MSDDETGPFVRLATAADGAVLVVCDRGGCELLDVDTRVAYPWAEALPAGASPEFAVHRANTHRATHPGDTR